MSSSAPVRPGYYLSEQTLHLKNFPYPYVGVTLISSSHPHENYIVITAPTVNSCVSDDLGMHSNTQHERASKMQSFSVQTGPNRACGLKTNCFAAWCSPLGHPDTANGNLVPVHFSSSSVLGCHMVSFKHHRHLASLISLWQKTGKAGHRLQCSMGLRNLTFQSLAAAKERHCFTTL